MLSTCLATSACCRHNCMSQHGANVTITTPTCTTSSLPASYACCSSGRAAATSGGSRSGASGPCSSNCSADEGARRGHQGPASSWNRSYGEAAGTDHMERQRALEGVGALQLGSARKAYRGRRAPYSCSVDVKVRRWALGQDHRGGGRWGRIIRAATLPPFACCPAYELTSSMPLASTLVGGRAIAGSSTNPVTMIGVVSGVPPALQQIGTTLSSWWWVGSRLHGHWGRCPRTARWRNRLQAQHVGSLLSPQAAVRDART